MSAIASEMFEKVMENAAKRTQCSDEEVMNKVLKKLDLSKWGVQSSVLRGQQRLYCRICVPSRRQIRPR